MRSLPTTAVTAQAVLQRAAVLVVARIGLGVDELVDQVAVGAVELDPVEAGVEGVACGLGIVGDDLPDFLHCQCARRRVLDHLAAAGLRSAALGIDEDLHAFGHQRRGGHRGGVARLQRGVRDPADVPELGEDAPAGGVHRVGDLAPAGDLLGAVDARCPGVALALPADLGAFGNNQAGAGALAVVLGHQRGGDFATGGAGTGHRRHDDAIGEGQVAKGIGAEQHDGDLAREAGRGAAYWKKVGALLAERFVRKTAAGENDT